MDDVWGNAWSTAGSNDDPETKKSALSAPKWSAFQRDADDDTVDVGASSWNAGSGLGWAGSGSSSNLWHAESSTLNAWGSKLDHHEQDAEDEEPEAPPEHEEAEDSKDLAPRTILPTPPQSPLPLPSPPLPPSPPVEESPPPSPAPIRTVPGSPDPFGSFESAQIADSEFQPVSSWTLKSPDLPAEATDEPWGGAWGRADEGDSDARDDTAVKDEWELAQEAKRRQERKVPPELLASLVAQWDEYAKEAIPENKVDDTRSQSWRKGLDNVEGLTELVESLIPAASFPPPAQLSKTAVSRALKESLRLTRSFALTRSSPMSHLYASKGSTDWERSVKAQKNSANDEWGWDLKHEPEEKPDTADSSKEKKGGGLLSFWSKRASSAPVTPTGDSTASNQPKSPTVTAATKPMSPLASAPPSIDAPFNASLSTVVSPTALIHTSATAPVTTTIESDTSEGVTAQPSAVSRFFNRFSRKPTATSAGSENENRSSLALSADDLSILSDMVPSTSDSSASLHNTHNSTGSLEAMLNSPRSGRVASGKLPPPLAPPPAAAPRIPGPPSAKSTASDSSFDAKMADAQLLDILENMGQSGSSLGYAPVAFDLADQPEEPSTPPPKLRSPVVSSAQATSPPPRQKQAPQRSSWLTKPNAILQSTLPPPLPPPMAPRSSSPFSSILAPTTPPPPSPLRNSFNHQRYDNPLPPTPQRDVDDFSGFFSAMPSSSQPAPQQSLASASISTNNAVDLGEYGDFVSHSPRSPSPPKVSQQASRAAAHKPTAELVEKAASMTGHWPASPPPLPPPLAPPPGMGHFKAPPVQRDLLGDDSPLKPPTSSGILPPPPLAQPLFMTPSSHPASTSIPGFAPPPRPASISRSATASPLSTRPATPAGKSGLSAQDLSFFEGL